jgi:hypothetical protein
MQFDREDAAAFSLLELAVLRGLGANRYSFELTLVISPPPVTPRSATTSP